MAYDEDVWSAALAQYAPQDAKPCLAPIEEGATAACLYKGRRLIELRTRLAPFLIVVLYTIKSKTLFGTPKRVEQEGFCLRAIDAATWLKGSVPDRWVDCNKLGPEAAARELAAMAKEEYPDIDWRPF